MSKKHKNNNNSAANEFSLNSESMKDKQETGDNSFFFKNENAAKEVETAGFETSENAEAKGASDEADSFEIKKTEEVKTEEKEAEKSSNNSDSASKAEKASEKKAETEKKAKKEKKEKKKSDGKKASNFGYFLKIAGVLTIICSFVALMLATVNMMTKDTIAQNAENEKKAAVTQIFTEADDAVPYENNMGKEIYLALKEGKLYGYCVSVVTQGYGGEINMMVGIRYDGNIQGVKIVSMSETAGLGSKTKNDSFLSQFVNKKGPFSVEENVDAVAGATISSKAVTDGVNAALNLGVTPGIIADRNGISLYTEKNDTSETESETEGTTVAQAPETTANVVGLVTTAPEDTHIDPSAVGQYQTRYYYQTDKSYTASRESGYYLEKETTDTESDTSLESENEI